MNNNEFTYVRRKDSKLVYLNLSKVECIVYNEDLKLARAITESGNEYIIPEEALDVSICSNYKIHLKSF